MIPNFSSSTTSRCDISVKYLDNEFWWNVNLKTLLSVTSTLDYLLLKLESTKNCWPGNSFWSHCSFSLFKTGRNALKMYTISPLYLVRGRILGGSYLKAFTKKQTTTITTLRETLKKKTKTKLLTTYDNLFILNSAMTWHQLFYSLLSNYNDMTCVSPSHRLLIAFYIQPIIQEWMCEQFHSPSTSVAPFSTALDLVSVSETSEAQIQCLIICSQRPLLWW